MKKIETIWHHLLWEAMEHKQFRHTQQELSHTFGYSLSTVHHAVTRVARVGAVRIGTKSFVLENVKKLLYYWASVRNLKNNVRYSTYYGGPILTAQSELPAGGLYGGYTAARHLLGQAPADYDKLYYYCPDVADFKKRFPENHAHPDNIFVLTLPSIPSYIKRYPGGTTSLPHTFVDTWNMNDWFAADYIKALEEKINGLLP